MRDRIIEWFSLKEVNVYIPGYWDLYITALIIGFIITFILVKKDGYPIKDFIYKTIVFILTSILVARIYGIVITIIQLKSLFPFNYIIKNSKTGSFGAYTGIIIGAFISNRLDKVKSLKFLDIYAPMLSFNLFLGRIGCFMSGCCYGKVNNNISWSVLYPRNSVVFINHHKQGLVSIFDQFSLPVLPTQLYESFFGLLLFGYMIIRRKKKRSVGELTVSFFLPYSLFRIIIEFFRDDEKIYIGNITLRQILYLIFLIICIICIIKSKFQKNSINKRKIAY